MGTKPKMRPDEHHEVPHFGVRNKYNDGFWFCFLSKVVESPVFSLHAILRRSKRQHSDDDYQLGRKNRDSRVFDQHEKGVPNLHENQSISNLALEF